MYMSESQYELWTLHFNIVFQGKLIILFFIYQQIF